MTSHHAYLKLTSCLPPGPIRLLFTRLPDTDKHRWTYPVEVHQHNPRVIATEFIVSLATASATAKLASLTRAAKKLAKEKTQCSQDKQPAKSSKGSPRITPAKSGGPSTSSRKPNG